MAIEYRWLPSTSPLPARLSVLRAILRILVSRPRSWWREGGREGWAAALLHDAVRTDEDPHISQHAATYVTMLLTDTQLSSIQTPDGWVSVEAIRERAAATATPPQHIIMLRAVEDDLGRWAA
jgi:hypothetical protein